MNNELYVLATHLEEYIIIFWKNYKLISLIAVAIFTITLYGLNPRASNKFALIFEDFKFAVRSSLGFSPEGDKNIVIVAVDEKSVNHLGRWPWDRTIIADLLTNLQQAQIIGLDIVFSEPTTPEKDRYLADVISDNSNIIPGYFFRNNATEQTTEEDINALQDCAYFDIELLDDTIGVKEFPYVEVNIPEISDAAETCAFFNAEPDADGMYRRYPLAFIHQGYIFPPLAVQALRYFRNKDAQVIFDKSGVKKFQLDAVSLSSNYFTLNYYQQDDSIYIPAVDILNGTVIPSFFKDKIVLVGVTEIGVYDMRPTPVNPITPGVWLHYTALSNLINNEMLHDSKVADIILILLALAVVFVSNIRSIWQRVLLYFALLSLLLFTANAFLIGFNIWTREFYAFSGAVILAIVIEALSFFQTEIRAGELKKAFTSYVSPDIVGEILKDPENLGLGGVEKEISVLFNDIRGFTSLSEQVSPTQLVQILTGIHDPMTNIVLQNHGLLDKYIGDAMMALFNAPLDVSNHADKAVRSAMEMISCLQEINEKFTKQGFPNVDIGIGVNTGQCIVGNMGSQTRFEYTAIGDAVNLAARLEGLCKTYKCRIIISEFTKEQLSKDVFVVRMLDKVRVKGKNIPVLIYEVMDNTPEKSTIRDQFENGLEKYFAGEFESAKAYFEKLYREFSDDTASVFISRCEEYLQDPPARDWQGIYTLKNK